MRRQRQARFAAFATVLALAGIVATGAAWFWSNEAEIGAPSVWTEDLTAEERAYVEFIEPRLRILGTESARLATLGEAKSRDAMALLQGQHRVDMVVSDIMMFIETYGVPPRFRSSAAEFTQGAKEARQSIREGRAALARLDWQRLESGVEQFIRAAALFRSAETTLDREVTDGQTG